MQIFKKAQKILWKIWKKASYRITHKQKSYRLIQFVDQSAWKLFHNLIHEKKEEENTNIYAS